MTEHHASARSGSRPEAEALDLDAVTKVYDDGPNAIVAVDAVSLSLATSSFTAFMGPSGSGKSSLLQCAAGLSKPTSGRVFVAGQELTVGRETTVTKFRRQRIGFVFQQLNLLPTLTVLQNVTLPLRLAGRKPDPDQVVAVLERVGLARRLGHRPAELSGGQQQRVAIARALVTKPTVLFADEPTGSLDTSSAREVLGLLRDSVHESGQTVVMVTHDPVAASYADRIVFLADGRIVGTLEDPTPEAAAERLTHLGDEALAAAAAGGG